MMTNFLRQLFKMILKISFLDKWHVHMMVVSISYLVRYMDSPPKESTSLLYSKIYKQLDRNQRLSQKRNPKQGSKQQYKLV